MTIALDEQLSPPRTLILRGHPAGSMPGASSWRVNFTRSCGAGGPGRHAGTAGAHRQPARPETGTKPEPRIASRSRSRRHLRRHAALKRFQVQDR